MSKIMYYKLFNENYIYFKFFSGYLQGYSLFIFMKINTFDSDGECCTKLIIISFFPTLTALSGMGI